MIDKCIKRTSFDGLTGMAAVIPAVFGLFVLYGYRTLITVSAAADNTALLSGCILAGKAGNALLLMTAAMSVNTKDGKPDWKKAKTVYFTLFFYNAVLVLLHTVCGYSSSITDILPVLTGANRCVSRCIVILILMPLFEKKMRCLTQKKHFLLCAAMLAIVSIGSGVCDYAETWSYFTAAAEIILAMTTVSYIRKYDSACLHNRTFCAAGVIFCTGIICACTISAAGIVQRMILNSMSAFPVPLLIICFYKSEESVFRTKRVSDNLYRLLFGAYLLADNTYFREVLHDVLMIYLPSASASALTLFIACLPVIAFVFTAAFLLETARKPLFESFAGKEVSLSRDLFRIREHADLYSWNVI